MHTVLDFTFLFHLLSIPALPNQPFQGKIPIGGIFDVGDTYFRTGFRYAVSRFNHKAKDTFSFESLEGNSTISDSFNITYQFCDHMSNGVFVILGGIDARSLDIIQSFSKTFHMPYVTHNIKSPSDDMSGFGLSMRPTHVGAIRDMIIRYNWRDIHYLYNSDDGLLRFQAIYRDLSKLQLGIKMRIRKLQNVSNAHDDLRLLDKVESTDSSKHIVLDLAKEHDYYEALKQVREMGMNRYGYNYLLGTLDIQNLGISRYKHGGVNITGFQLIDYSTPQVKDFLKTWKTLKPWLWPGAGTKRIELDAALAVDALRVIRVALQRILANDSKVFQYTFRRREVYNYNKTKGVPCIRPVVPWMHGDAIINGMKKIKFRGVSGKVAFNKNGFRKDYKLDVYKVSLNHDAPKIGVWRPNIGYIGDDDKQKEIVIPRNRTEELQIVTSILQEPFLMDRCATLDSGQPCLEHNRYEGYCAELAKEIAQIVRFKYRIQIVADGIYGVNLGNNTWNGIIQELKTGKVDIAVAPLTITSEREHVVDFSKPFLNLGISIMIKKPDKQKPGVFSFLQPISFSVWMCLISGYFLVSLGIFFVSRCSPSEWQQVRQDNEALDTFYNNFTFGRSMWFAMGSLMLQGSDRCPRSVAGRVIGGAWWFGVLFMISTYTANLAAFLTVEQLVTEINSADDLAKQTKIAYGCVNDGATREFFKNSIVSTFQTMSAFMDAYPDVLVDNVTAGVERVQNANGRYAFLMESVYNDYINNKKPCNTMKVGPNLNSKGYGIATPQGSPLRYLQPYILTSLFNCCSYCINKSIDLIMILISNIRQSSTYDVYLSKRVRFAPACSDYKEFLFREQLLTYRLLTQGYIRTKLVYSLNKIYERHLHLVSCYAVSVD